MKIQIPSKSNFIRAFLSPISKIDNTPDIKIEDDKLSCFVDRGSDVFLFARYNCKIEEQDTDNFVLPDANKLIKALNCSEGDQLGLIVEDNYIKYRNKSFKFKYFLFDRSIKKDNSHIFDHLKQLEDSYNTKFEITKDDLRRVLKTLPLLTESSKLYLYTAPPKTDDSSVAGNYVYGDLCDKKLQNTDVFTSVISESYEGEAVEQDTIILNLELFRMINSLNFEKAQVYINSKFKVVNIKCEVENSILNYVVSSHKG
tara:strand:+ start:13 stop:783 length:771 start_codon:yes stop_codon:yes gene_type:complete